VVDYGKPQRETVIAPFRRASGLVTELQSRPGPTKLPPTRPLMTQVPALPSTQVKPTINKAQTPLRADLERRLAEQRAKPVVPQRPRPIATGGAMANDPPEVVGGIASLPPGGKKIK